jgi:transcriptional regulator with XRE-family HTH domain
MTAAGRLTAAEVEERTAPQRVAFGWSIFDLRKALGLSQEKLGERLGVDRQTVLRTERATHVPSLARAILYARSLGTTVGALLGEPVAAGQKIYVTDYGGLAAYATREAAVERLRDSGLVSGEVIDSLVWELEVRS